MNSFFLLSLEGLSQNFYMDLRLYFMAFLLIFSLQKNFQYIKKYKINKFRQILAEMQSDKSKNLIQFNANNQPQAIKYAGMTKIKGEITKSQLLVDSANIKNVIQCLTLQVKAKYKAPLAQNIIKRFTTIMQKKIVNLQKNWFIFDNDNGCIGYYGLLWHKKGDQYMIGVYEFSIQFSINKDVYIKRFQSYSQSKSFLGGTDKVYVVRDSTQTKSRGLAVQDVNLLVNYSNIMQNQFSKEMITNKM